MPSNNESTMKWKVDVTQLKAAMQEAKRAINQANAEFKTATAGMDKWSKSADGLEAKLEQLNKVLPAQKRQLEVLEAQYEDTVKKMGENSSAAADLKIKIEEQKATITKTETSINKYNDQLADMEKKQAESESATGKLSKTISEQEKALTDLKKEYANAVLMYGENSDEAKALAGQIDKLSGELVENKTQLSNAEKAADELDKSLEDAGKSADDAAGGGFTVLKGALANLVTQGINLVIDGLKNLGKTAYDAWAEFDEGADIIITKTGATGEAAEDLQKVYKNVSKQIVGSYDEMGTAVGEVNTRFGVNGKQLEDLSVKFLKFAKLNGTDVNSSIDSVQAAMAAWGLTAEDAGDMLDVLNKAGQDTGVSVDQLADSLMQNAPALQEMGFSASDAAMFLANLDKNGVDASATMGGLKKALATAAKEGKPMNEAMADMEKAIKGAGSETEAIQKAMDLFGTKAGPAIAKAVRSGKLSFEDLGTTMKDFEGNVNNTFEDTLDAPDKFALAIQGIRTDLADVAGDLMEKYAPQIESAIETIKKVAEGLFKAVDKGIEFFTKNGDTIIAVIKGIAAAVGVYLAYTTALQVMTNGWKSLAIVQKVVAAGQAILNTVMAANPIGLVIAAIAGLVAAFVALWNKSEAFREFWIGLWETVKEIAGAAWEAISGFFSDAWAFIQEVWGGVTEWFSGIWESIKEIFSTIAEWINENVFMPLMEFFQPVITFFTEAWTIIQQLAEGCWLAIKAIWSVVSGWFNDNIVAPVKNFFSGLWSSVSSAASTAWSAIKSVWSAVSGWFNSTIIQPVSSFFSTMWNKLKSGASSAWSGIKSVFEPVVSWFKDKFSKAWKAVKDVFSTGGKVFDGIKEGIVKAFKTVVNAIIRGINKVIAVPFNAINGILDKIAGVSVAGIKPFAGLFGRLSVPQIPELVRGGILKRGQVGFLEGTGAEAVVPLENNKKWIAAVVKEMINQMDVSGLRNGVGSSLAGMNGAGGSMTQNITFNQTINSPKAVDRLTLYRETNSLLFSAKVGLANV